MSGAFGEGGVVVAGRMSGAGRAVAGRFYTQLGQLISFQQRIVLGHCGIMEDSACILPGSVFWQGW